LKIYVDGFFFSYPANRPTKKLNNEHYRKHKLLGEGNNDDDDGDDCNKSKRKNSNDNDN